MQAAGARASSGHHMAGHAVPGGGGAGGTMQQQRRPAQRKQQRHSAGSGRRSCWRAAARRAAAWVGAERGQGRARTCSRLGWRARAQPGAGLWLPPWPGSYGLAGAPAGQHRSSARALRGGRAHACAQRSAAQRWAGARGRAASSARACTKGADNLTLLPGLDRQPVSLAAKGKPASTARAGGGRHCTRTALLTAAEQPGSDAEPGGSLPRLLPAETGHPERPYDGPAGVLRCVRSHGG